MIQVNELRIGSLVNHWRSGICTLTIVDNISEYGINGDFCEPYSYDDFSNLMGIPLTEEWLLKAGFQKADYAGFYYYEDKLYLQMSDNKDFTYEHPFHHVKINSVHQLQNLFFILCGQELTFNQ